MPRVFVSLAVSLTALASACAHRPSSAPSAALAPAALAVPASPRAVGSRSTPSAPTAPAASAASPANPTISASETFGPAVPALPSPLPPCGAPTAGQDLPAASPPAGPGVAPAARAAVCAVPTFPTWIATLRRGAESGADGALARHADLLDAVERFALDGTEDLSIREVPDLEVAERARLGRGTVWAIVATYVEPSADLSALLRAHLDYDRIGEWTGKPVARVIEREPVALRVQADGIRKIGPLELGARWQFGVQILDRGAGRIAVTAKVPSTDELHMLSSRGLILLFPDPAGVRVVEASCATFDMSVPGFVRAIATGQAEKEMRLRVAGIRAHWREYLD